MKRGDDLPRRHRSKKKVPSLEGTFTANESSNAIERRSIEGSCLKTTWLYFLVGSHQDKLFRIGERRLQKGWNLRSAKGKVLHSCLWRCSMNTGLETVRLAGLSARGSGLVVAYLVVMLWLLRRWDTAARRLDTLAVATLRFVQQIEFSSNRETNQLKIGQ